MPKPDEIRPATRSKHAKVCVFGDPGIGKTRFIGTSPGKVLIVRPPTDHVDSMLPADRARVEEWVVSDWEEMNRLLEYLRMEGSDWDWVWVDSVSLLYDHLLDDIWETTIAEKPARARYDLDKPEFGINMSRLGRWVRHVIGPDLFNFGFTAHTAQLLPSPDEEAVQKLMPWIQGKNMSPKFCGYMNVVAFMEVATIGGKANRRVLRLNATERYYAKDQFDLTTDGRIVDPTMVKMSDLIDASRSKAQAAKAGTKPRRRAATKTRTTRRVVKTPTKGK